MKRILVIVIAALFVFSMVQSLFAQAPADGTPPMLRGNKPAQPQSFEETKAGLLKRMDDRIKRMTEERACVEAAKNQDDLKKCRPERPAPPGGQVPGAPAMMQRQPSPMGQPPAGVK